MDDVGNDDGHPVSLWYLLMMSGEGGGMYDGDNQMMTMTVMFMTIPDYCVPIVQSNC